MDKTPNDDLGSARGFGKTVITVLRELTIPKSSEIPGNRLQCLAIEVALLKMPENPSDSEIFAAHQIRFLELEGRRFESCRPDLMKVP